ncbi:TetR/AcrR family transcriptional regulator [Halalkalibacter lacteus]|uniref:TetR/AcrR family transcriptional regulator n=1 Tax=Halalkalibacter lacteus TaxID=3090663 RepID=UPI002FC6AF02
MSQFDSLKELLILDSNEETKFSEKQLKIIEAAIEIFSEKGFAATSTSEIAKKAGVAEGTIFRHYKTKKELLVSIVSPLMTKLLGPHFAKDFAQEVFEIEYESFETFIRNLASNRYEFVKKYIAVVKILIQEISYHEELKEPYVKLFKEHVYEKFKKIIIRFQEKDEIVDWSPDTIMRLIITTLMGTLLSLFLVLPETDWDNEAELETTIQFLINGLSVK